MRWLALLLMGAALLMISCGPKETPEAAFLLDEAHQASNRGDYTQAVKLLGQIINQYPGSKEAAIASEEYDTFKDLFRYEVEARKQAEMQAVKKVGRAVEIFHQKKRRYPENLDVLIPHYLPNRVKDPWGNQVFYKKSQNGYMIACFGKDGVPGGQEENRDVFIQNGQFVSKLILSSK